MSETRDDKCCLVFNIARLTKKVPILIVDSFNSLLAYSILVGDATRIPIIQEQCKAVFGVEQVSRTLNSLECVARGASL